jgi:hypothetical protein
MEGAFDSAAPRERRTASSRACSVAVRSAVGMWGSKRGEPSMGSSVDGKGEEGIDRSFEGAAIPQYLGE